MRSLCVQGIGIAMTKSLNPKPRYELAMLAMIGSASVLSGIAPASRVMWFTEMFLAYNNKEQE